MGYESSRTISERMSVFSFFACVTFDPLGVVQRSYCTNKEGGAESETDMFSTCRTWAVGR